MKMNIKSRTRNNKPYTARENKLIWDKYHNGMHPETIAIQLSRTEKGIYNQITTLKKTLKPRPRMPERDVIPSPRDWPEVNEIIKVVKRKEKVTKKNVISNSILIGYSALITGFILGVLVTAYIA